MSADEKTCSRCGETKPRKVFSRQASTKDGLHIYCKECMARYHRERRLADPEKIRESGRKAASKWRSANPEKVLNLRKWLAHRVTLETFNEMLDAQGGKCAICLTDTPGKRGFAIDHDHSCCPTSEKSCGKCIRGLLCARCNTALGYYEKMKANPRTEEYLQRTAVK